MSSYVAFKPNVGTVTVATEPGVIYQFDHEVHYDAGDSIFTSMDGKQHIIPESMKSEYISVSIDEPEEFPIEDKYKDMASAYESMDSWLNNQEEDETYIKGTAEIAKERVSY
ncbi:hypothetical protein WKH57_01705 [Niallia taxi]|uniref:hypothetical protein n=1 Tax=Niallia taxi TaxID=2499688 RepID=UPI0031737C77